MRFIDKLERKFRRFGIPNLMIYITATMLLIFLLEQGLRLPVMSYLSLDRARILQGQVWRLITFIFEPASTSPIWILFSLMFYYFIGTSLENFWGPTRFTIYYVFGMIGTIIGMFIVGYGTNAYLNLSLFLVFAYLSPNTEFRLFFILPVKAKYLAYIDVLFLVISFVFSSAGGRMSILFAFINFFLFFGPDLWRSAKNKYEVMQRRKRYKKMDEDYRDHWR